MRVKLLLIAAMSVIMACSHDRKLRTYLKDCNNRTAAIWRNYSSEQFSVLTQYKPVLLNAITETGRVDYSSLELDSLKQIYGEFTMYRLFLSDYFMFSGDDVLDSTSTSSTLKLEDFLEKQLLLIEDGDTIRRPHVHVDPSGKSDYPVIANVVFMHPDHENFKVRSLNFKSVLDTTILITFSKLESEEISEFIK